MEEDPIFNDFEIDSAAPIETRPPISQEVWTNILESSIKGNRLFPQAYMAQGILVANRIVSEAAREGLPVGKFFDEDPPLEYVEGIFKSAMKKSHAAYGIKPSKSMISTDGQIEVWNNAKDAARNDLLTLAVIVSGTTPYADDVKLLTSKQIDLIESVQNNPIFRGLLEVGERGLLLDEVKAISKSFKEAIADFMHKYTIDMGYSPPPSDYSEERKKVGDNLAGFIESATSVMKNYSVQWMQQHYPQEKEILLRLLETGNNQLYSSLNVAPPHPKRHPDYE